MSTHHPDLPELETLEIEALIGVSGGFETSSQELEAACAAGAAAPPPGWTAQQGCLAGVARFSANKEDSVWQKALDTVLPKAK